MQLKKITENRYKIETKTGEWTIENGLPSAVTSFGRPVLSAPMRLRGTECGAAAEMQSIRTICTREGRDGETVLLTTMESRYFIFHVRYTFADDGLVDWVLHAMPRGKSVAEVFGLTAEARPAHLTLDQLTLDVPVSSDCAKFYRVAPTSAMVRQDGTVIPDGWMTASGACGAGIAMPFKCLLLLSGAESGLCFCAESDENWQPADENRAIELVRTPDGVTMRLHLLDKTPEPWIPYADRSECDVYRPVTFRFGFMTTPVRQPVGNRFERIFHVDCFVKIAEDYLPFFRKDFGGENGFDRLKRMGVTTLILHEKWNQIQNCPQLTDFTAAQAREIVAECHRRGIRVLPYFGYEISSLSRAFAEHGADYSAGWADPAAHWSWYRQPPQRAFRVCYQSGYAEEWLDGVTRVVAEFGFDGVYLDTTASPMACCNRRHGCGYERRGQLRPTYPIHATRDLMRQLRARLAGKRIDFHDSNWCNVPALPYVDGLYTGEVIQTALLHGELAQISTDYMQSSYNSTVLGVPMQFVSYNNETDWTFDNALTLTLAHGILPRPNDIGAPLEEASRIWDVLDAFPIAESTFRPYWAADAERCSNPEIRVTAWDAPTGERLMVIANLTGSPQQGEVMTASGSRRISLGKWGRKLIRISKEGQCDDDAAN